MDKHDYVYLQGISRIVCDLYSLSIDRDNRLQISACSWQFITDIAKHMSTVSAVNIPMWNIVHGMRKSICVITGSKPKVERL